MPFTITLIMGACAFISPTSTASNLAVYRPGGYKFADYVRIGLPLTVLNGILTIFLVPVLFSFNAL
jgi:di/tricarboxylate transporter